MKIIKKTTSERKKLYDEECKALLSQPIFLARILKSCIPEVQPFEEKELVKILESVHVETEKDLSILEERQMRCDIFFKMKLPTKQELYFDIEIQNEDNPRICDCNTRYLLLRKNRFVTD